MKNLISLLLALLVMESSLLGQSFNSEEKVPTGFTKLFNGLDFSNWKLPTGDNNHWKIIDKVIDYDGESEAKEDKNLWTNKSYKDFVLYVDWRIKGTWNNPRVPFLLPNGFIKKNEKGELIMMTVPDSDSGILLRGNGKCQANIQCWPVGSGEVHGCWTDTNDSKKANHIIPKTNADKDLGEWNTFKITMKGQFLTVELNGVIVIDNALLGELAGEGSIGLQHHGIKKDGQWVSTPSLVQFRHIYIKEL